MFKKIYNKIEDFLYGAAMMGPEWYATIIAGLIFATIIYVIGTMG